MKTRAARQMDLLALRALASDARSTVLAPSEYDEAAGLLQSALKPSGEKTWIAEDDAGLAGFARARPRKYVLGWEMIRLHARPGLEVESVVCGLVHEVLQHLQERRIPRLFARTPAQSFGHEVLLTCGFTHLLSESIFVREPSPADLPAETPVGMRFRMPQDAWPLRQLENSQTPLLVSQLEGLTSLNWSTSRQYLFRKKEPTELVVEREGEIVGWVGWRCLSSSPTVSDQVRLGFMTACDDTEMASSLLDYALHAITSERPNTRVVVRLRDYQLPLRHPLVHHGFVESHRDTLHIKHGRLQTAPTKMARLFELAPTVRALTLRPAPTRKPNHA